MNDGFPSNNPKSFAPIAKSGNFTAILDREFIVTATATVTDPTPAEGRGFVVFVRNGTATVGGTGYPTAGTTIRRVYHSGAWANYVHAIDPAVARTLIGVGDADAVTHASLTLNSGAATSLRLRQNNNVPALDLFSNSGVAGKRRMVITPIVSAGVSRVEYQRLDDTGAYLGSLVGLDLEGGPCAVAINGLYLGTATPTSATAGDGLLQLAPGTTKANGIAFGADCFIYRSAASLMRCDSAQMIGTGVAFTDGAAAAAGTLLNAPSAGNPTKWIPINDNGTTRYIPAW